MSTGFGRSAGITNVDYNQLQQFRLHGLNQQYNAAAQMNMRNSPMNAANYVQGYRPVDGGKMIHTRRCKYCGNTASTIRCEGCGARA